MPRPKGSRSASPPSYRLHRKSGQAVVTLNKRDIYLGPHNSPESREAYDRAIAEWLARGRREAAEADVGPSVNDVIAQYWGYVQEYYAAAKGRRNREPEAIRLALRPLRRLYGRTPAKEFGPKALAAVQAAMVEAGLCRKEVNKRVKRIVRAWKWAVSRELVPATNCEALRTLEGLRKGRTAARETEPIKPAPEAAVFAAARYVLPTVRAMIEVQLLTGMRPGEVCMMRGGAIDRSGPVWAYTPDDHKTDYLGNVRKIFLGPKAQEILRPWLKVKPDVYLFSPREAVARRREERRSQRKTRVQPSQVDRSKRKPKRAPGEHYTPDSYREAVTRACRIAGVEPWHPHQLRHNAATRLRAEFGLEIARVVLGHGSQSVTEIYAEQDFAKAREAMAKAG